MKKILSLILVISLVIPLTLSFADVNTSAASDVYKRQR